MQGDPRALEVSRQGPNLKEMNTGEMKMTKKLRKVGRLLSPEEKENRHVKHPISTEPAISGVGIPEIPARKPTAKKGRVTGNERE
jgi:hypothetical protein